DPPTHPNSPALHVAVPISGNTATTTASGTLLWTVTGGTITGGQGTQSMTYTAGSSGTATVSLKVTNASSCSATNSTNVTVNDNPPTPSISTASSVCVNSTGNTATTTASGTLLWTVTGGTITAGQGTQSMTYTAGASGTAIVSLSVTNGSGCSAGNSTNVTINDVPATPSITANGPTTFCQGGNVTLQSSSGSGNQWYLGGTAIGNATGQQYIANASGDYTVIVTTN